MSSRANTTEHWLVIIILVLMWRAYQQTVADGAQDHMVKQRMLNNLFIHAFLKRQCAVRRRYCWRPLALMRLTDGVYVCLHVCPWHFFFCFCFVSHNLLTTQPVTNTGNAAKYYTPSDFTPQFALAFPDCQINT